MRIDWGGKVQVAPAAWGLGSWCFVGMHAVGGGQS